MAFCTRIKGLARRHEWLADLSSMLAVALLFGTIWICIDFQAVIFGWLKQSVLLHGPAAVGLLLLDVLLIFMLLNIGSTRLQTADGMVDDRCFGTFRGRRHGGPSLGTAFRNWITHIEQVNKHHR